MFHAKYFFLISNKDSLISKRERHPSSQGAYRGEKSKMKITKVKKIQNRRKMLVSPHREPVK